SIRTSVAPRNFRPAGDSLRTGSRPLSARFRDRWSLESAQEKAATINAPPAATPIRPTDNNGCRANCARIPIAVAKVHTNTVTIILHRRPWSSCIDLLSSVGSVQARRWRGPMCGICPVLDVAVGPFEHFRKHVQDGFAGAVAVALVRQEHQPGRAPRSL